MRTYKHVGLEAYNEALQEYLATTTEALAIFNHPEDGKTRINWICDELADAQTRLSRKRRKKKLTEGRFCEHQQDAANTTLLPPPPYHRWVTYL